MKNITKKVKSALLKISKCVDQSPDLEENNTCYWIFSMKNNPGYEVVISIELVDNDVTVVIHQIKAVGIAQNSIDNNTIYSLVTLINENDYVLSIDVAFVNKNKLLTMKVQKIENYDEWLDDKLNTISDCFGEGKAKEAYKTIQKVVKFKEEIAEDPRKKNSFESTCLIFFLMAHDYEKEDHGSENTKVFAIYTLLALIGYEPAIEKLAE